MAYYNGKKVLSVVVNNGGGSATLIEKNITANGTYAAEDDNADGYSEVTVNVQPTLQQKTATPSTSQQTVTPDSGYNGLSQVTVGAVTAAIDNNIAAGNIKNGVTILGVTGTALTATISVNQDDTIDLTIA